jgi:hypothetical protein
VQSDWKNNPLLPWATFRMTAAAVTEDGTNSITPASLNSLLNWLHLAEKSDPDNGAFGMAEACLKFAARDNQAALAIMETACRSKPWHAGNTEAFASLVQLFQQAGCSELDAVFHAQDLCNGALTTEDHCLRFLNELTTQAVSSGRTNDFSRMMHFLVELRKVEWSDPDFSFYYNPCIRSFPNDDLVQAIASQMKTNLPAHWAGWPENKRKTLRQSILKDYSSRYADPVTAAVFESQSECYQTEDELRHQLLVQKNDSEDRWWFYNGLTSVLSILALSLLCVALCFEIIIFQLGKHLDPVRTWPRDGKFWLLSLLVVMLSAISFANFLNGVGVGVEASFNSPAPDLLTGTSINWYPLVVTLLVCMVIFTIQLGCLLIKWKRGKYEIRPWKSVRFYLLAYLIFVIAMAIARHQLAMAISDRYQ